MAEELIATMMWPFFYLAMAFFFHERQKIFRQDREELDFENERDSPILANLVLFFALMGLFSAFLPLSVMDVYFNNTSPYNSTAVLPSIPALGQLYFTVLVFVLFVIVTWGLKWWKINRGMI